MPTSRKGMPGKPASESLPMCCCGMAPRFVAATEALTRGIPHYLHNGSALP